MALKSLYAVKLVSHKWWKRISYYLEEVAPTSPELLSFIELIDPDTAHLSIASWQIDEKFVPDAIEGIQIVALRSRPFDLFSEQVSYPPRSKPVFGTRRWARRIDRIWLPLQPEQDLTGLRARLDRVVLGEMTSKRRRPHITLGKGKGGAPLPNPVPEPPPCDFVGKRLAVDGFLLEVRNVYGPRQSPEIIDCPFG